MKERKDQSTVKKDHKYADTVEEGEMITRKSINDYEICIWIYAMNKTRKKLSLSVSTLNISVWF